MEDTKTIQSCVNVMVKCPDVNFTSNVVEGILPFTVQFFDTSTLGSSLITEWKWDFGDGTILEGSNPEIHKNPIHEYTSVGLYTVALTVSNEDSSICVNLSNVKKGYIRIVSGWSPQIVACYCQVNWRCVGCLPILATGEQPAGSYNGMFSPVISSRDYLGTSNSTPFFGPDFRDYPFMYPPRDHTVIYKGETIVKNFDRNLGGLYMAIGRVPLDATSVRVYVLKGNIGFGDQVTINPPDLSRIQTYFDADVYRSAINHVTIIEPFELIVTAYL